MAAKDKENQPNREELFQMAESTARRGQKEPARMMFRQVLEQDKRDERTMLWMARLAKSKRERRQWLERILMVNPDNELAQAQLNKMEHRQAAKENRTVVLYGTIAGVLIIITIIAIVAIMASR
jgi:hypothetical protein